MRLQIFSDVHIDVVGGFTPQRAPNADAVVVAGDVCEGIDRAVQWLRTHLGSDIPIILVAGNHEYFARIRSDERATGAAAASRHAVTFLDNSETVIGGVRFLGTTLWADYALFGEQRRQEMMDLARRTMMDHRRILEAPGHFMTPEQSLALHRTSRAWLTERLAESHPGPTVVVTHHGPHPLSLAERFRNDLSSAAFISDLSPLIEARQPALWVHGHTHVGLDYRVGRTRVLCNPRGYGNENPAFDAEMLVEI